MKKQLMLSTILTAMTIFSLGAFAHDDTEAVSLAKASELSLHRLEKLVNLKSVIDGVKIDKTFISQIETIEIEKTPHTAADEITFIATLAQVKGIDGTSPEVELSLNSQGKTLVQHARAGTQATNAPVWPLKSPVDLLENGLHYVIDNALVNPELKPFNEGVYKTTLKKIASNGKELGQLEILSKNTPATLLITLDLEAKFLDYEIK